MDGMQLVATSNRERVKADRWCSRTDIYLLVLNCILAVCSITLSIHPEHSVVVVQ